MVSYTSEGPKLELIKGVEIIILGSSKNITLCKIIIDPGSVIEEHSHINEQIGTCIKGMGELISGGEVIKVEPGISWTIPANEKHSYTNKGYEPAIMIEAFSPPREDYLIKAE